MMEEEKPNLVIDETIHVENIPETSMPKTFTTQWKGTLVPMNDHSDKEAVLYTCPNSGLDYRFILHRKNHQKADNYACARCKSRKKYVRILIAGEYFLEDPAKLDHICYLGAEELRKVRESMEKVKSQELLRDRQNKVKKQRPRTSDQMLDLSRIQHETSVFPFNAIASLFEEQQTHSEGIVSMESPVSGDDDVDVEAAPVASSLLDSVFVNTIKVEREERREQDVMRSDPEPKEPIVKRPRAESFSFLPTPHPEKEDGSFYISLNRALSGIRPDARPKAENEILRFVYSKLYEKYSV